MTYTELNQIFRYKKASGTVYTPGFKFWRVVGYSWKPEWSYQLEIWIRSTLKHK